MKEFIVLVYFIILIHQTVIARVINTIEDDEDDISETKKHHRSKRHIKQNNLITEVENLYSCVDDGECCRIRQFNIAKNYTINCYKQDILITFEVNSATIKNQKSSGYLRNSKQGVFLSVDSLPKTSSCNMIKK